MKKYISIFICVFILVCMILPVRVSALSGFDSEKITISNNDLF